MKTNKLIGSTSLKVSLLATLALTGCITTAMPYMRAETAQRIASPAWMIKRDITANQYILRSYERIHNKGGFAHIYIEGDGSEFSSPKEWQNDPTPKNPVALHLASKDNAKNVIYLARPCQYTDIDTQSCEKSSWKENRFSQNTIDSFSVALDDISRRYNINGFHLIGYSGGAAIATLLAAQRSDISSVRTVAGTLDHVAQSNILGSMKLSGSLNPVDITEKIAGTAQYHFIGGQDAFTPPAILHSYIQASPTNNCIQHTLVQEAGHDDGWVDKWSELLKLPVTCYSKPDTNMVDFGEVTKPVPKIEPAFITLEKPAKP